MTNSIVEVSIPNCRAHSGRACPVIGKPSVPGDENARNSGEFRNGVKGPSPPNLPGEIHDGLGAPANFAVCRGDAHFTQQILWRQVQKGLHARVLQSRKAEPALFERPAEAPDERGAYAAIAVEENPAAPGMSSFYISHF